MENNEFTYNIVPQIINGKKYYYAMRSYREKINLNDIGKTKGSGKSKVISEKIYLGDANAIMKKLTASPKPLKVKSKEFGLPAAMLSVIRKLKLDEILDKYLPYKIRGIKASEYIIVSAINKASESSSKERTGHWFEKTVLDRLLGLKAKEFNSNNYWDIFDKIISEKKVKKEKDKLKKEFNEKLTVEELEKIIDDNVITEIEKEMFTNYIKTYNKKLSNIQLDTTNSITYYQDHTRNSLGQKGKHKQGRNNKRLIGYLLASNEYGIPIFHKTFCGNIHDSKLFISATKKIIEQCNSLVNDISDIKITFDKGNNSKKNIEAIKHIKYVGSIPPSSLPEYMAKKLTEYKLKYKEFKVFSTEKDIFGATHKIYITFNENLKYKQEASFNHQKEKIIHELEDCYEKHKTENDIENKLNMILHTEKILYSKAIRYLDYKIKDCKLHIQENIEEINIKSNCFGKNVIFTNLVDVPYNEIIETYKNRYVIEEDFKNLKDYRIISFLPFYHWTDSKICIDTFVSTYSLFVLKIIQTTSANSGLSMSINVLISLLKDIRESLIIYNKKSACRLIEEMTSVQSKLFDLFELKFYY